MTSKQTLVNSKIIKQVSFHNDLPMIFHPCGVPSISLYIFWAYFRYYYGHLLGSNEFYWFFFILVCSVHALLFLIPQWSVSLKAKWTYSPEPNPLKASSVCIIPEENNGLAAICPVERGFAYDREEVFFYFQKKKFVYNPEKKTFEKLKYLHHESHDMGFYKKVTGLKKMDIEPLSIKYGENKFDVPLPTFLELFKEHMVAPFFVFQLFCVCLWFLDDMWYFSLFTLFMLFVFESTVVFQRLRNLQEFRAMSIMPYSIQVYRDKQWHVIQTDKLLPGDVCSIIRQKDDHPIAADFVLINGSCIANEAMLSGESTPQLKEPILLRENEDILKVSADKAHILFGGTKILQVTPPDTESAIRTPDGGCLAVVLRSGFATQQGKLVRTIIYSTERVSANNAESLFFILFLLVFAIIAAWYVWTTGSKEDERDQTKLLLHCIMIITSVVPPELPMELSMAVNNSLAALSKSYVYCTEPFRIPFAGRVDVACFDKTGTLTAENLVVEGITGINEAMDDLLLPTEIPTATVHTLAAAHALVMLEDGVIGDPMEKNTLESIKWNLSKGDRVSPQKKGDSSLHICRRFPFSSALKRMSTVSYLTTGNTKKVLVACKGAPETLKSMLKSVPKDYDEHYKYWARRGKRVLALGYKTLGIQSINEIRDLTRKEVESELVFAGFLIFYCPLKDDSVDAIRMLNESSHRTVMITGDNALTACHIAREVEIVKREVLIADTWDKETLSWKTVDEKITFKIDVDNPKFPHDITKFDLCCTGSALSQLAGKPLFYAILPRVWVYARVSPSQKEYILKELKSAGYYTLMCGDGTNDVGALKQAHVGIALLDGTVETVEKIAAHQKALQKKMILEKQEEMRRRWAGENAPKNPTQAFTSAMEQIMSEIDENETPTIKFGDASVAAPFTSKVSSVMSVVSIIRQGRATLVALTQMYKILALNSLIMAYTLSVLHLAGIKQGDWQATVAGMMITVCFFGLAKSTALEKLSPERPQPNIFNLYIILSVLGQSAIHVASLVFIGREAVNFAAELAKPLPIDAPFEPNLLNSGVYLVSLIMQISTFAINYQGLPFRESILQNRSMRNSLGIVFVIAFAAAAEISPELNNTMQLVEFPDEFRYKLLACMSADFLGAWLVEYVTWYFFSNNKAKKSLFPK
ncbi:hypothetical protein HDV06_003625 [Boothiomyces sp. JEL0866]|nr:hypothetical protein HDV06_003625 [Boothiomyces sp. JEL0866]